MSTGWIVLGVLVVLAFWIFSVYNGLVAMRQRVDQSFADIDVQLKQRHDLIPNLVETVKGYASHERGTLEDVVKARNAALTAQGPAQVAAAEGQLTQRAARPARAVRGLSGPQGQHELPAAADRALRHREQARRGAPLLQQLGAGVQHRHRAASRRPVRRLARLPPQGVLRPRRNAGPGRTGAQREVLTDAGARWG